MTVSVACEIRSPEQRRRELLYRPLRCSGCSDNEERSQRTQGRVPSVGRCWRIVQRKSAATGWVTTDQVDTISQDYSQVDMSHLHDKGRTPELHA
jgi:hypothetical protein